MSTMREKLQVLESQLAALDAAPIHKKERAARQALAASLDLLRELVGKVEELSDGKH